MAVKKNKHLNKRLRQQEFIHFANYGHPRPRLITPEEFEDRKHFWGQWRHDKSEMPNALSKLKTVLDRIIQEQKLVDSQELQYFIGHTDQLVRKLTVTDMRLESDLGSTPETARRALLTRYWLRILANDLIHFLMDGNLKNLRKCKFCEDYFIASRDDRRIIYCQECSPSSKIGKEKQREAQKKHREKKRQEREEERAKARESTILHYMDALGISRREAEKLWRADNA
jgi:hypothetical protein